MRAQNLTENMRKNLTKEVREKFPETKQLKNCEIQNLALKKFLERKADDLSPIEKILHHQEECFGGSRFQVTIEVWESNIALVSSSRIIPVMDDDLEEKK